MRDQLQKDYSNTFSLPGETAIKQHIRSLFATSKKADKDKNDNDERDTTGNTSKNEEWKCVVNDLVNKNPLEKPENIYQKFLTEMTEVRAPETLPWQTPLRLRRSTPCAHRHRAARRTSLPPRG